MRIALCDDDAHFLAQFTSQLRKNPLIQQVSSYSSIKPFFYDLESGEPYDVVLMDLDWGAARSGLTYGEDLYHLAPHLPVIFITGYADRFAQYMLLHEVNLVGYLTKPIDPALLDRYLQKILHRQASAKRFGFLQQGRAVSLDTPRIQYLESENHITVVHTDTASYKVYERLSALLNRLPENFIQCHKSYAVNLQWLQRMDPGSILLKSGQTVPVSRSYANKTRQEVFSYLGLQI